MSQNITAWRLENPDFDDMNDNDGNGKESELGKGDREDITNSANDNPALEDVVTTPGFQVNDVESGNGVSQERAGEIVLE